MAILTLKVFAGLLQLHGPGATIQSDHPGIDALLPDLREQSADKITTSIQSEQNAPGPTASEDVSSDKPIGRSKPISGAASSARPGMAARSAGAITGRMADFRRGFGRGW